MENWYIVNKKENYDKIKDKNFTSFQKMILANRDITSEYQLNTFHNPSISNMHSPLLMKDIKRGVDVLFESILDNENIRIVGDYDQDGVAATVILMKGIGEFYDKISYTIPDRIEDGYGINNKIVDECIKDNVNLIITCDNGISAIETIQYARNNGIKVIVTDHHQPIIKNDQEMLPIAEAVINPHQESDKYPFKDICGAMVAFKFIQAIHELYGDKIGLNKHIFNELIQFATLGTVCDMMKIIDENRLLVIEGLRLLNKAPSLGIETLINAINWEKEISMYTIGYLIGPIINASGRIYTANLGVELFVEENESIRFEYAKTLIELNNQRKQMTIDSVETVINKINQKKLYNNDIIIVYEKTIHESICGLVAGKIKELYYKPCIVLTDSEQEGILKGSGRSITSYNMFKKLNIYRDNYVSFGGHKMACGISILYDYLEEFSNLINRDSGLQDEDFIKELEIDYALSFNQINENIITEKDMLSPFGYGFNEPIFATKNVIVKETQILGKNKNVVKIVLEQENKRFISVIFDINIIIDSYAEKYNIKNISDIKNLEGKKIDIVYKLEINEYMSHRNIQLSIISMR